MNLQFNYLYRDAGNYKNFGNIIFSNPDSITASDAESKIRYFLIDKNFFYAEKLNLQTLYFDDYSSDDHALHEFESISETKSHCTDQQKRTIQNLIDILRITHLQK